MSGVVSPGDGFGRLTAVELVGRRCNDRVWRCRCVCGAEREVLQGNLRSLNTQSCGCLSRELSAERTAKLNLQHGKTRTRAFGIWSSMVERTTNKNHPAWHRYGGRGIAVCERWKDFEHFLADMGEPPVGLGIDRIDNDRGYEPGNCRWASPKEQAANRGTNRRVALGGRVVLFAHAASELGVSKSTIARRVAAGLMQEVK